MMKRREPSVLGATQRRGLALIPKKLSSKNECLWEHVAYWDDPFRSNSEGGREFPNQYAKRVSRGGDNGNMLRKLRGSHSGLVR